MEAEEVAPIEKEVETFTQRPAKDSWQILSSKDGMMKLQKGMVQQ